jgi:hypothetical protein
MHLMRKCPCPVWVMKPTRRERFHRILEANGAFYNGINNKGHAQKNQNISFNIIQP